MSTSQLSTSMTLNFEAISDFEAHVVNFAGSAALNSLYEFNVTVLVATDSLTKVDWNDLLSSPCSLVIENTARFSAQPESRGGPSRTPGPAGGQPGGPGHSAWRAAWHGQVTRMETGAQMGDYTFLEIGLGPALGLLAGQKQNRIHLDLNSLDVIRDSFKFGGLNSRQFKFEAKGDNYPKREFVFQYEEDLLDFILRTLQREGLALYFDQTGPSELIVITDSAQQHPAVMDSGAELDLACSPVSSLRPLDDRPLVFNFKSVKTIPPLMLLLKDYSWEDPNRTLAVSLKVADHGRGMVHLYGENFTTEAEGQRLARIRREEYLGAAEIFKAETSVPGLMPGLTFSLSGHPLDNLNDHYLVTATELSGSQAGSLSSRLGLELGQGDHNFFQRFTCQRLSNQFRPARSLPAAKISGSLTAWIDGAGSGQQPEIDQFGRYKVIMPLDVSGRGQGKASAWLRMAQPHVGSGYGHNFPLTPGAEVLLTFIDGNPDRPLITGAVANAENANLINSASSSLSGLGSRGGSALLFDDTEGSQKVVLGSGSNRGAISLSANSPTNALVQADYVNILNYSSTSLNSGLSKILTGHEHLINADNSKVIKAAAILQAAKTAAQVTNNASTVNDSNNTDQYKESEMVSKVNGLIDLGINDIFLAVSNFYLIQGLISESPFLPHRNLLTLETSDTGAKSSWKSKTADTATLIAAVGIFGNLFNATTAAVTAAKNSKDMEAANNYDGQLADTEKKIQDTQNTLSSQTDLLNQYQADMDKKSDDYDDAVKNNKPSSEQAELKNDYEASKATYEGQAAAVNATKDALSKLTSQYNDLLALQASSEARTLKRLSAGAAIGSNLTTVIGQILAVITTSLALYSKLGEPEGILVNSKDSYVNVKANTYASVSGYGPVIIESTNTPISDFLRLGLYDGQRPVLPITPELPKKAAPAGFANYTHTKAVVLSSNLVRAMAQEVSLVSGGAIVGKAEDQIQLIAGVADADVVNQTAANEARSNAASLREAVAAAPVGAKDARNIPFYNNALTYLNIPDRISADRALNKGILIKTQGQATPLYLQTAGQDSPIEITQGTGPAVAPASSRSIRLSSDGTTVQDGTNVKLELKDTSGAATLQVSPATSVKMSPDKVAIAANASVSIDLSSTDIDLSAANQISLSTGGNKIVLSQAGVKITSNGVTVNVLPACLQLAS